MGAGASSVPGRPDYDGPGRAGGDASGYSGESARESPARPGAAEPHPRAGSAPGARRPPRRAPPPPSRPRRTAREAEEIADLWGRLDRIKQGIGAWVLLLVTADYGSAEFEDAHRHLVTLTADGIEVREEIQARTRATEPAPPPSPADGVNVLPPVVVAAADMPTLVVDPDTELGRAVNELARRPRTGRRRA